MMIKGRAGLVCGRALDGLRVFCVVLCVIFMVDTINIDDRCSTQVLPRRLNAAPATGGTEFPNLDPQMHRSKIYMVMQARELGSQIK